MGVSGKVQAGSICRGVFAGVVACSTMGCAKPLLSPKEDRTQYDRYDRVRNQHVEQYEFDEFGRRRPNLRARLLAGQ